MILHWCVGACDAYKELDKAITLLTFASHGIVSMDAETQRATALTAAEMVIDQGKFYHWELSAQVRAAVFHRELAAAGSRMSTDALLRELHAMQAGFLIALGKAQFAYIPPPNDKYFEQERLFGESVHSAFTEARADIKAAGNCFAMELYTACVFHLMRVAEFGLRAMAKRLKVTISDHGKNIPLEYGDWNKVIEGIENKLQPLRQTAKNVRRESRVNYYSDALERCSAMKDLYRNPVSHTRTTYNRGGAEDVMERVERFMQFLAQPVPK